MDKTVHTRIYFTSLFLDPDLQEYSEAGTSTGTDLLYTTIHKLLIDQFRHFPQLCCK